MVSRHRVQRFHDLAQLAVLAQCRLLQRGRPASHRAAADDRDQDQQFCLPGGGAGEADRARRHLCPLLRADPGARGWAVIRAADEEPDCGLADDLPSSRQCRDFSPSQDRMNASVRPKPPETTPNGSVPSPDRRRETGMLAVNRALAVVIVAHNDAQTLQPTLDRVYRALTITIEDFSMIVFDDGSSDDTMAKAEAAAQQYPFVRILRNERQMGVGYCTMQASRVAEAEFIVYVPADNTWPLRSFIELFGHLGKADIITSYSNNLLAAMPWPKRIASRAYTGILNLVFRKGMRYYNGLTIYPTS